MEHRITYGRNSVRMDLNCVVKILQIIISVMKGMQDNHFQCDFMTLEDGKTLSSRVYLNEALSISSQINEQTQLLYRQQVTDMEVDVAKLIDLFTQPEGLL